MPEKQTSYKKRNAGTFISNTISAGITGLIFGLAGAILGASSLKGLDSLAGALMGLIAGYPLGVIIRIIWINKVRRYYGSLLFGAIGAILGTLIAIALEEPLKLELDPIILFGTFFVAVPLLSVIGFYLKNTPKESA